MKKLHIYLTLAFLVGLAWVTHLPQAGAAFDESAVTNNFATSELGAFRESTGTSGVNSPRAIKTYDNGVQKVTFNTDRSSYTNSAQPGASTGVVVSGVDYYNVGPDTNNINVLAVAWSSQPVTNVKLVIGGVNTSAGTRIRVMDTRGSTETASGARVIYDTTLFAIPGSGEITFNTEFSSGLYKHQSGTGAVTTFWSETKYR